MLPRAGIRVRKAEYRLSPTVAALRLESVLECPRVVAVPHEEVALQTQVKTQELMNILQ
jgi:hypothetical protein